MALLANYALHYVGPGVSDTISADYFGLFADRIQELLEADRQDPPFVGILTNGASADINNINWPQRAQQRGQGACFFQLDTRRIARQWQLRLSTHGPATSLGRP